jgi:hypothetical protein
MLRGQLLETRCEQNKKSSSPRSCMHEAC